MTGIILGMGLTSLFSFYVYKRYDKTLKAERIKNN